MDCILKYNLGTLTIFNTRKCSELIQGASERKIVNATKARARPRGRKCGTVHSSNYRNARFLKRVRSAFYLVAEVTEFDLLLQVCIHGPVSPRLCDKCAVLSGSKHSAHNMASLPPLRARAVTKIFSGRHGIGDLVRRISQPAAENFGVSDGASTCFKRWIAHLHRCNAVPAENSRVP